MKLLSGILNGDILSTDTDIFLNEVLDTTEGKATHSSSTVINKEMTRPTDMRNITWVKSLLLQSNLYCAIIIAIYDGIINSSAMSRMSLESFWIRARCGKIKKYATKTTYIISINIHMGYQCHFFNRFPLKYLVNLLAMAGRLQNNEIYKDYLRGTIVYSGML